MKTFAVLLALVSVSLASSFNQFNNRRANRPVIAAYNPIASATTLNNHQANNNEVHVTKETLSDNVGIDGYRFGYALSDGTTREENARVEVRGNEDATLRVSGSFSFYNPEDGKTYAVSYVADENGFQPQGDHLPVAPKV